MEKKLTAPILFLIFNRPDTTQRVFNEIRRARPTKLFVAADGPRKNKEGETGKCQAARDVVSQVDWDCKVYKLFRDKNLGCKIAVSSAIDWFFENVEEGIILEDDCLPHPTFFRFCQELLEKYRDDERIMHIGGYPHPTKNKRINYSYFFSKYPHIWGWASWRRAWKYYDVNLSLWPKVKSLRLHYDMFNNKQEAQYREKLWDSVYSSLIDTWDYQWVFAVRLQSGLSILPKRNLIKNIGVGPEATHAKLSKARFETYFEMEFPMQHPEFILVDSVFDSVYSNKTKFSRKLLAKFERLGLKIRLFLNTLKEERH